LDSELPILRYIFVHHVREFPFLDKAREKEFWQDKLQVVSSLKWRRATWGRSVEEANTRGVAPIVSGILREQEYFIVRRPS
jgi:hypothetical protein